MRRLERQRQARIVAPASRGLFQASRLKPETQKLKRLLFSNLVKSLTTGRHNAAGRHIEPAGGGCYLTKSTCKLFSPPRMYSPNPKKNEAGIASSLA